MRAFILCLGLAGASVLSTSTASAQEGAGAASGTSVEKAAKLAEEGATLYKARNYTAAVTKFQDAYALDPDPNLLFNLGRCFEALGETDLAIERYERFVASPGADSGAKIKAQNSLKTLKELKSTGKKPEGGAAPGSEAGASTAATSADGTKSGVSPLLPWMVLGGGVVVAAVGGIVYGMGAGDHSKITDARGFGQVATPADITERDAADLKDSGDTKKVIGGVLLGLGGAAIVGGVVLLVTSGGKPSPARAGFVVAPTPGGGALGWSGRF